MVKQKALPGKRYCKKCQKMIPIHCRVCRFCSAPQYTMQQITKEYKKRQKFSDEDDHFNLYDSKFYSCNGFESAVNTPGIVSDELSMYLSLKPVTFQLNSSTVSINPLSAHKSGRLCLINPCGQTNSLAFSFSSPPYLCISLCEQDLVYGRQYEGPGLFQLWELASLAAYKYSVIHHGFTVLDMKFLPCKNNKGIGTLAACLANGDLCIYNLPFAECQALQLQPVEIFRIPGLIFSCVTWIDHYCLAAGTQDGSVFYIRPGFGSYVRIFAAHRLPVTGIIWCASSSAVASTSLDGYLKAWDKEGKIIDRVSSSKRWSYHVCNNPLGKYLFYDNDAAISPHKVIEFTNGKLESKKQLSLSAEATLCSCFSPLSSFAYILAAEGFIECIYVSELEKNSKKRKTPWNRYSKIVYISKNLEVFTDENVPKEVETRSTGVIKNIDLSTQNNFELVAWTGKVCGVYQSNYEDLLVMNN